MVFGRRFAKRVAICYRTVSVCLSSPVGLTCLSVTNVGVAYCGQTVRWINMKLGMQVGLGQATLC